MDCYFLKFKITEFDFNPNSQNIDNNENYINNEELTKNNPNINYEIVFELTKSNEIYTLKIINDNNGSKTPFTYYFTLPTLICINKNNNSDIFNINNYIEKDFLEISLYLENEEKKLIDINDNILIDNNCINKAKFADLYLGDFHFKFLFKLSKFEDLCIREKDMCLMIDGNHEDNDNIEDNCNNYNDEHINDNNDMDVNSTNKEKENNDEDEDEDLVTKYHNLLSNKPIEDDIIYDDSLFQEIEPIDFEFDKEKISQIKEKENNSIEENNNNKNTDDSPTKIYHDIKSINFFDINADIFEEEENEDDEDIIEDNNNIKKDKSNIYVNKTNNINKIHYKIYRNNHLILYENISLEKPKLKEIINNNLIDFFLIAGLSQNKQPLANSESYIPQCKHKNCQYNNSFIADILYRLQKPNISNYSEIDSASIANLIFPYGIKICYGQNYLTPLFKKRSSTQFQEPDYSFNVLTDIKGKRYYIYSLIFFIYFEYKEFIKYFHEYKDINTKSTTIISKQINNQNLYIPFSFTLISKVFDLDNFYKILNDLYTTFYSSQMEGDIFDNELINLVFELPGPPINSKIKIYLPYLYTEIKSNIYENKIFNNLNYYQILFQKNCYSICFIIKIFILFLLEKKILIHSSKQNKIYETIEVILSLIYPLKWVNAYIPLIPDNNINIILQSFLPFIIGMIHQSFFNYANKIEQLNSGNNNQNENYDNIFVINLDTENILPTKKMNELVNMCPVYETIEARYHNLKDNGEDINSDKIRNIFLEGIIDIIGDYERYTSRLGENNLFNQKIFLRNKEKKFLYFYQEMTSTQQFCQFINEVNNDDDIYFNEFKDKVKMMKNIKNEKMIKKCYSMNNNRNYDEEIYLDEYNLYPYFFKHESEDDIDDIDLFSFEDEVELYYNCLNKEHKISYLLDTEAYIRIKLILQNYIPNQLRKYEIKKDNININKNKKDNNVLYNIYNSNYDSNISDLDNDKINNIKNIFGNFYGKMKKSLIKNIFNSNSDNKENINSNNIENNNNYGNNNNNIIQNNINKTEKKILYRRRDSLINMIRNSCDKKELLKYKEQIIDLLKDYMGYIFSNEREDIPFSLDELSKLFTYRRIRREFSKILYQNKFDNNIEHELTEETFNLLYQTVFFCLVNLSDNNNEYRILRRLIKSMFYYFYKDISEQKIYLYQKIIEKNEKFYFIRSSNFWKYYYKTENLEFPEEDNLTKIKNIMNMINVNHSIVNYLE